MDGGWTDWNVVGACSVTCGNGLQKRTRTCTNPQPAYGGKACPGNDTDHIPCHPRYCSGVYGDFFYDLLGFFNLLFMHVNFVNIQEKNKINFIVDFFKMTFRLTYIF